MAGIFDDGLLIKWLMLPPNTSEHELTDTFHGHFRHALSFYHAMLIDAMPKFGRTLITSRCAISSIRALRAMEEGARAQHHDAYG